MLQSDLGPPLPFCQSIDNNAITEGKVITNNVSNQIAKEFIHTI